MAIVESGLLPLKVVTATTQQYGVPMRQTTRKCFTGDPPTVFPPAQPQPVSEHVPEAIREEVHEAQKCFVNRTWRASALMARRALEAACDHKSNGNATGMLGAKLKWLKDNDLITSRLLAQARPVQDVGNDDEKIGDDLKVKFAKKSRV